MASLVLEGMKDNLLCIICHDLFTEPKSLACLHTFCRSCLQGHIIAKHFKGRVECPTCGKEHELTEGVDGITTNFNYVNMIEQLTSRDLAPKCDTCTDVDDNIAQAHCTQCNLYLCNFCVKGHKRSRTMSSHNLIMLQSVPEALVLPSIDLKCSKHPRENLCMFCVSHDLVICTCCTVLQHNKCSVNYIDRQTVQAECKDIETSVPILNELVCNLTECKEKVETSKASLAVNNNMLLNEIETARKLKTQKLDSKKEQIEELLSEIYKKKMKSFNCTSEIATELISESSSLITECDNLLNSPPSVSVLLKKKELTDRIGHVKDEVGKMDLAIKPGDIDVQFKSTNNDNALGELVYCVGKIESRVTTECPEQGRDVLIHVHTKTCDGESINRGGAKCTAEVTDTYDESITTCPVEDNKNGTYTVQWKPIYHSPSKLLVRFPDYEISEEVLINVKRSYTPLVPLATEIALTSAPWGVCMLPQNRLAVSMYEKQVRIYDVKTSEIVREIRSNFARPYLMAVDKENGLWVTDREAHNVQRFSLEDHSKTLQFGSKGKGKFLFSHPRGIAVHPVSGLIYVADMRNHCIQIFRYERQNAEFVGMFGGEGNKEGEFSQPAGIAFNQNGDLVVCDDRNCRLQLLSPEGRHIQSIGVSKTGRGLLCSPIGVAIDTYGRYIVGEFGSHCVTVLSSEGNTLSCTRSAGGVVKDFTHPRGVTIDENGFIYIADFGNQRIVKM